MRDECIIHRLCIGHTHFTHAFLLKKEDPPECIACQLPLTVEHILLSCVDFMLIRHKYFTCTTLANLFTNVPSRTIVDFIKEIGLYHKVWILTGPFLSYLLYVFFSFIYFYTLFLQFWKLWISKGVSTTKTLPVLHVYIICSYLFLYSFTLLV